MTTKKKTRPVALSHAEYLLAESCISFSLSAVYRFRDEVVGPRDRHIKAMAASRKRLLAKLRTERVQLPNEKGT